MFTPSPIAPDLTIADPAADFRGAKRVEQYRVGREALYLPAGLRWNYLPICAIEQAGEAHRVVSAGHCVTVREERPTLKLETAAGPVTLNLEKKESLVKLLKALNK